MDRTAWIVVIICAFLSFYCLKYQADHMVRPTGPRTVTSTPPSGNLGASAPATPPVPTLSAANPSQIPPSFQIPANFPPATTSTLENDYIRVTFTTYGGAIQQVELLKHKVDNTRNVVLNDEQKEPVLNLRGWDGDVQLTPYELVTETGAGTPQKEAVTFTHKLPNGDEIERTYSLSNQYQIILSQTVHNPGTDPLTLPGYELNVGVAAPVYKHDSPIGIAAAWQVRQDSAFQKKLLTQFETSGPLEFFGLKQKEVYSELTSGLTPLNWIAVKNQFFTSILTPPSNSPATQALVERLDMPKFEKDGPLPHGIKTYASFNGTTVPAQGSITDRFDLYAGPKEYAQIKTLGQHQDDILEFGQYLGWLVKILLTSMNYVHQGPPGWHWDLNYGWVVIIVTLIIKLMLWPLQSAANRSMKSMQVLQPRIKELQEKYKEEPQKLQTELMKTYKDYGVNPIGGCLPMVFQIPILIAFYSMLQNAIELRHVSWLWVHDLSQPDTIFSLYGIDFNPLPLSMTLTQWVLMKMTPTAQDNQQMKMMQWMPFLFLFMLYNFAAALSLYWTVNNLVTLVQTYRNLKKPLPKLERRKKPNPFGKK